MELHISSELLAELMLAAAADPSREVCGLLLGKGRCVAALLSATNVSPQPETRFEIDPTTLIGAHKAARAGGLAVIGAWHSHPNGEREPSLADLDQSETGMICVIVALGAVTAWLREEGGFAKLAIIPQCATAHIHR